MSTYGAMKVLIEPFFKLGFTPCKAEQPLQGMQLQGKKSTKRLKHTGNLFRKNLHLIDRAYSTSVIRVIIAHNYLPFFKIIPNFVHFCRNFQIFFPFCPF